MLQHHFFTLWFALETTITFYLRLSELSNGKHQFCRLLGLVLVGEVGVIYHQVIGHHPKEQFQTTPVFPD